MRRGRETMQQYQLRILGVSRLSISNALCVDDSGVVFHSPRRCRLRILCFHNASFTLFNLWKSRMLLHRLDELLAGWLHGPRVIWLTLLTSGDVRISRGQTVGES